MNDHKYLPVTLKSITDYANQTLPSVKPSINDVKNLYFPDDNTEEVLLLLLLTEMLVSEAISG